MADYVRLAPGDPAPWFTQRSYANPRYTFDSAAGRWLVLCFYGSAADRPGKAALAAVRTRPGFFDDENAAFFGVSSDPADETERRVANRVPGYRFLWDFDGAVARLYGALPSAPVGGGEAAGVRRMWVVLDPMLRVRAVLPFEPDGGDIAKVLALVDALPSPARHAGVEIAAPVLLLPDVFEPGFCRSLVDLYERHGGEQSGFMREIGGRTVGVHDASHKRRRDHTITDAALIDACRARFVARVVPMVRRAHQFEATRMERYIVACYLAEDQGHFGAHRDNTTKGTAHRRFAVSVNLNDDFDGGEVGFPEFGPRRYRPPVGGAVVFSCSLLHAVSPVTRGRRYCFLPFLYDEAAARTRAANAHLVDAPAVSPASPPPRAPGSASGDPPTTPG